MLTLKLTPEMIMVIGKALGAQPYDTVATVVVELQKQIDEQQKTVTAEEPEVKLRHAR